MTKKDTKTIHTPYGDRQQTVSGMFVAPGGMKPLDQFDLDCLSELPDAGTKIGRYIDAGLTVAQIKKKLDPSLPSGFVATHLKLLRDRGFVVALGESGGKGRKWQRTPAGHQALLEATTEEPR